MTPTGQKSRRLLVVYDPVGGLYTYRVRGTAFRESLARHGWQVEYFSYRNPLSPLRRKVALLSRRFDLVYLLKIPTSHELIRDIHRVSAARVIFDLTDALWLPAFQAWGWQRIDDILAESEAVFCCNRYDEAYARRQNSHVYCLPSYSNVTRFSEILASAPARDSNPVVIGWVGSDSTLRSLHHIAPVLERVAELNPNVVLRVVGCPDAQKLPALRRMKISLGPAHYDEDAMIREIIGMDMGLFPLVTDEEEYQIRGTNKALNYMAGRISAICHNAGECATLIADGVSGMLARTPEEWVDKINLLVRNPDLRREIGFRGYEIVRQRFSREVVADVLEAALQAVLAQPVPRSSAAAAWRAVVLRPVWTIRSFLGGLVRKIRSLGQGRK